MENTKNKKFKLRRDLNVEVCGVTLFRIEATEDIEKRGVKTGDIGGYVEKEENLSGDAWVYGNARVYGDAEVCGNARVYGDAKIEKPEDCKNIIGEKYNITILPELLEIGCQMHSKKEWWNFTDREILAMDGRKGLLWWKKWKPVLMTVCED